MKFSGGEKTNKDVVVIPKLYITFVKWTHPILLNYSISFLAAELPKQCCHFQGQGKAEGSKRCIFVVCDRYFAAHASVNYNIFCTQINT